VTERFIDRALHLYRDSRVACGSHQFFEPGGRSRPIQEKALPDDSLVGSLILLHEVTVIPGNQLRPKVPEDPSGLLRILRHR
jgi:hypothetical protein